MNDARMGTLDELSKRLETHMVTTYQGQFRSTKTTQKSKCSARKPKSPNSNQSLASSEIGRRVISGAKSGDLDNSCRAAYLVQIRDAVRQGRASERTELPMHLALVGSGACLATRDGVHS